MYRLLLISLALLVSTTTPAKSTVELYTIEKAVETEGDAERMQLLPQALTDILVRVTGDKRITDNTDLQAVIQEKAGVALQRFSYISKAKQKRLHLEFSSKEIKNFLTKYRLTYWPGERPEVIVWLTYTGAEGNQWEFVTEESKQNFVKALTQQADWRGLPINFPMLDLQDLRSLTDTQDITEQGNVLKNISKRYHADYVLAVSITEDKTGEWRSQWKLMSNSETLDWEFSAKNMIELFVQGVDATADAIVERTAVIAEDKDSPKQLMLSVSEISSVEDYLKAMHYIQSMKGVERVEVAAVNSDRVNFEVFLNTGIAKDAFKKLLQKEAVLSIVENKEQDTVKNTGVMYCRLGGERADQATA